MNPTINDDGPKAYKNWRFGDKTMEEYALAVLLYIRDFGGFVSKDELFLKDIWGREHHLYNGGIDALPYAGVHAFYTRDRLERYRKGEIDWYGEEIEKYVEKDENG